MLKFDAKKHRYTLNGKELPSVTRLIGEYLGDDYTGIPAHIIEKAGEFGTTIHNAIEMYEEIGILRDDLTDRHMKCLNDYLSIKSCEVIETEQIVYYKDYYAGTIDCIAETDKGLTLIDYKTSSKAYPEKWAYQLSLYKKAYEWMTGKTIESLQVYHLKKTGKSKVVEIEPIDDNELRKVIHEY